MGAKAIEITDANFDEVTNSSIPVLVDFWAVWCGPCKMIAPIIEELAEEMEGRAVIGKMDVDNNPNTAVKFGIRSIPSLYIFKDGKEVDRMVGAVPKNIIKQKLEAQLA